MSFEEYATVRHDTPYVLHLVEGDRELVYYGSRHSFDPADPMFDDIERRFDALRPAIAFNEGGNPPTLADRDAAILNHGEPGFLRHLGSRSGVEVRDLDLPGDEESRILASRYGKAPVLMYYVVRQLGTYNNMTEPPELGPYLDHCIDNFAASLEMDGASLQTVRGEFERAFGEPFAAERIGREYSDPVRDEKLTQRIARDDSIARDRYMVDTLLDALDRHGRVFAVMGASHVVMQERALRSRLRRR